MKTFDVGNATFFEFQCDDNLVERLLEKVKHVNYNKTGSASASNYISVGYQNTTDNKFTSWYDEELYNWLQSCLDEVSKKCFYNFQLRISDLWSVQAKFGQTSILHKHGCSILSGLLYLTSCKRSETVFSYTDHLFDKWAFVFSEEMKMKNKEYKITPEKGKLIIWPSDFLHLINPHTDKETRYTIAFNTFLEGQSKMTSARLAITVGDPCKEEFVHTDKPY